MRLTLGLDPQHQAICLRCQRGWMCVCPQQARDHELSCPFCRPRPEVTPC